jgi:hypothetical protein
MENGTNDLACYLSVDHNRICPIWQVLNANKPSTPSHFRNYDCFSAHYGVYFNPHLAETIGQLVKELMSSKNQIPQKHSESRVSR